MRRDIRENITYGSAVGMLVFGVILTTAGFIIPPQGEIHDSVLYVLGQCLIFSGSVMGVGAYATGKMRHIERSLNRDIDNRFRAYERGLHIDKDADAEDDVESEDTDEQQDE